MARIVVPYKPRDIFVPFHKRSQRWSIEVDHRRAGKTVARINELIRRGQECTLERPRFVYIAPLLKQAKAVAWDYLKHYSRPFKPHGATFNESELRVDYPNSAQVRLYGADNPEALRGIYIDGCVMDEFGDMDPNIWPVVRPALSDRNGWADFIGSAKGKNTFYKMYQDSLDDPEWYSAMHKASETGILSPKELSDAEKTLSSDAYKQEYECSFEAAVVGSYYGQEMWLAESAGRITDLVIDPALPMHTASDLGTGGNMRTVWFQVTADGKWLWHDYHEYEYPGLEHAANIWEEKQRSAKYKYGVHLWPHDGNQRDPGNEKGERRCDTMKRLGFPIEVLARQSFADGIEATRRVLKMSYWDRTKCGELVSGLRNYRRKHNKSTGEYIDEPEKNGYDHTADAVRTAAMGQKKLSNTLAAVPDSVSDWKFRYAV